MAGIATTVPLCASASFALRKDSGIGACKHLLARLDRYNHLGPSHLGEIDTKRIHVHAVQKTGKALAETRQTLMHQLQMHEIGFEVGHGVGEFCKLGLQGIDRRLGISCIADTASVSMTLAKRRARAGPEGSGGPGGRTWARRGSGNRSVHSGDRFNFEVRKAAAEER